jgi:hypothetical protein
MQVWITALQFAIFYDFAYLFVPTNLKAPEGSGVCARF